ncbi:S1-like domain-containing RNA-binding protein [Metabacillus sp. GX 13764]|uniref:CvfB family protein n=1 Tax=Metabacillus kandeliae TaxID=2900151 RepID=UPI001E4603DA|nr:S1-like domain-containing RNA-binding protein [Metabacillus kandeliae]MCD7034933.1 S1-like domain-containing RNA-binding protein [Metabacillus kandeliae]
MRPGTYETLTADERVEFGFFLTDGETRVLLHDSEITEEVETGDEVEVFLFLDFNDRLAATMKKPMIHEGEYEWLEVVDVVESMGAFVNIGLSKDALAANDILPEDHEVWPEAGDKLYCTLRITNNGRFFARPAPEEIVTEKAIPAAREVFNKNVSGHVYRSIPAGSFILTIEGYKGFIHHTQVQRVPRLGEFVTGRVIDVKEDGSLNVSLLPRIHEAQGGDAEKIFEYMESRGGAMPYGDKSDPEDIKERFGMSKGAFKRGLGYLMKEKKVYQEDGWTYKTKLKED